jgi:ribonucleoside-diphosphate reductase alpha chain
MDSFATAISLALQYGVPLEALVNKFSNAKFDPFGPTRNRNIPFAKSVVDYIFRWLGQKFIPTEQQGKAGILPPSARPKEEEGEPTSTGTQPAEEATEDERFMGGAYEVEDDAPPCYDCGAIMVRNGSCYKCLNCGSTSGCS